jgi:hypothetical protein
MYCSYFWFAAIALISPVAAHSAPDRCNDILHPYGAFEAFSKTSSRSADEQTFEWLKTVNWSEFKSKQEAGLKITLPVEGVPIPVSADGTYSQEQFQQFLKARDEGRVRFFKDNEFSEVVKRSTSKTIADDWLKCMQGNISPVGLRCWSTDDEQEDGVINFNARYYADESNPTLPIVQDLVLVKGTMIDKVNTLAPGQPVTTGGTSVTIRREGRNAVTIVLKTTRTSCDKGSVESLPSPVANPTPPPVSIKIYSVESSGASDIPSVTMSLPVNYKVIGGGALANWHSKGSLLTASAPQEKTAWFAKSKAHSVSDPSTITAWAIGLLDPRDEWDVQIKSRTVPVPTDQIISTAVSLDPGYAMTSGGALAKSNHGDAGPGVLLTASYPSNATTWTATAKAHTVQDNGELTAYVIGIKARAGRPVQSQIFGPKISVSADHPSDSQSVDSGWLLTGGGARTDCQKGNLLTASYPVDPRTWRGEAKAHTVTCPSPIWVYAIGVKAPPGSQLEANLPQLADTPFTNDIMTNLVGGAVAFRQGRGAASPQPIIYIAQRNDSLRKIALRFYANYDWRRIFSANASVLKGSLTPKPGTVLTIPPK